MLYLAIDQHKNYLTINIRNEQGNVFQKGQVSTSPDDIDNFFVAFVKKSTNIEAINKHNLSHDAPTQDSTTQKFRKWIKAVVLPVVDRLEVNMNIESLELYDKQIIEIESELVKRAESSKEKMADVYRLKSIPGISAMGAITLLSRIGDIKRFKNPDSFIEHQ